MKSLVVFLLLPSMVFAQREGAFKEDLLYVYVGFITICLLLAYGGKMIKWISHKFTHLHE
ncbi:MAG: hypothetical protein WC760_11755 [Bacteroidia bacterium]